jgi:hypothetical protein
MITPEYKRNVDRAIRTFVKEIKTKDGLVGIILLGGLGKKQYFDELSDVDMSVFISGERRNHPDWLPEFEFDIFMHDNQRIHFNVHQQNFKKEKSAYWDDTKKDAYSNGLILYEKEKMLSNFLKNKLRITRPEYEQKLMTQYIKIPPSCLINPEKQLKRGEIGLTHQIINNGIENLIDLLFIINKKFIPHYKWKLKKSFDLKYKPNNFQKNIHDAMLVRSFTEMDVKRRIKIIKMISNELMRKVEKILSLNEELIYQISCNKFLNRQLLKTPFGTQIRNRLEKDKSITREQIQKITGLINFHTINDYQTLEEILKSGLIFDREERKTLLDIL